MRDLRLEVIDMIRQMIEFFQMVLELALFVEDFISLTVRFLIQFINGFGLTRNFVLRGINLCTQILELTS